jgi:molybdate transport system substrate-binding protein
VLLMALAGGCGQAASGQGSDELVVFAASSLTESFNEIKVAFEAEHPGVNVIYNFAGTPTLRTQLEQGAIAGVFASANAAQMEMAVQSGVIEGAPVAFAANRLVVIAPSGSDRVRKLSDLFSNGVKLVLALPDVPVGAYSRDAIAKMDASGQFGQDFGEQTLANLVSEESNVRQIAAKVVLGEADTGIVYATDVTQDIAEEVRIIDIPDEYNVVAVYPIAQVSDAPNPGAAQAFIEFVRSPSGQSILEKYGFGRAP